MRDLADLSSELLFWYDRNARDMPWRTSPSDRKNGITPDPYHIWMSEIMLQQTTVAAVKEYFLKFTTRWPTVQDLANAADEDVMAAWAGLGYYARARNLLKCARAVVTDHGGIFPDDHATLLRLPGIGPYTAAAVSSIAFDQAYTVLDGNVERVMSRLYRVKTPLPAAKPELTDLAANLTPQSRPGDYAQAVMDLGATICTPKSPACGICPWITYCEARKAGDQAEYPKKTPKKPKPTRHGIAYIAQRKDGAWLLERRPAKGLLGGMLGWPGAEWGDTAQEAPPVSADWKNITEDVRHTFTHFHLILQLRIATVPMDCPGMFISKHDFQPNDLPTVMRKAFAMARSHMSH
ncbi:A/G-specific adenine glycosylase [Halocynthiibacter sp.]|uniref:A/G-specific adenine glycosylase n=1 Tax=Halocynthiibacter sp. TaxID=1979210 RepID=UPI003C453EF6